MAWLREEQTTELPPVAAEDGCISKLNCCSAHRRFYPMSERRPNRHRDSRKTLRARIARLATVVPKASQLRSRPPEKLSARPTKRHNLQIGHGRIIRVYARQGKPRLELCKGRRRRYYSTDISVATWGSIPPHSRPPRGHASVPLPPLNLRSYSRASCARTAVARVLHEHASREFACASPLRGGVVSPEACSSHLT